jgi:Leucine-rich repeat (LRR) protein
MHADPARSLSARDYKPSDYTSKNDPAASLACASAMGFLDLRCCGLLSLAGTQPLLTNTTLRVLDVRYNYLTSLSNFDIDTHSIVILNASHNNLASVENDLDMHSMSVCDLSFNALDAVPSVLGAGRKLQQLYLANNHLSDLPEALQKAPLIDLFLSENSFTCAPGRHSPIFGCFPREIYRVPNQQQAKNGSQD